MSKKSDWWTPASLEKEEEAVAKGGVADPDNDFGSYKIMRESESVKGSKISHHNEVRPQYRAHQLRDFLQHQPITRVLDAGCGLGYTTSALSEAFAGAEVVGVDVSTDAIAYAKKTFLNCDFYVDAIDPDRDFKFGSFDLICAFEFYPFTRSGDAEVHAAWIEYLCDQLRPDGKIAVWQVWGRPNSLYVSISEVVTTLPGYKVSEYEMPHKIISRYVGNRKLALYLNRVLLATFSFLGRKTGRQRLILISPEVK